MKPAAIGYVNVYVRDLEKAVAFFRDDLQLGLNFADEEFGYASFSAGPVQLGVARIDPEDPAQQALVGRQTGVGFVVDDLVAAHAALEARGVRFTMPPEKQPWGGFMALFADTDGNTFYLDQVRHD